MGPTADVNVSCGTIVRVVVEPDAVTLDLVCVCMCVCVCVCLCVLCVSMCVFRKSFQCVYLSFVGIIVKVCVCVFLGTCL